MKELSIEEKAKAYDEALKVLHKYDGTNIILSQSLKEEMFPELKENRDEKVKKSINRLIRYYLDVNFPTPEGFSRKDLLDWIEKQGEQETLCDKCRKAQPSHSCQDITALGRCALEKQGEKKPAEWSEEDEKILSDIIKDLVHPWNEYIPDRIEDEIKWLKNKFKSLRPQPQWKPSKEQLHILESVIADYDNQGLSYTKDMLCDLYEDLKKLKDTK